MKNLKNIILNFFSDSFLLVINIITSILIARSLGPELKGVVSFSISLIQILTPIFLFGISSAYRYYLSSNKLRLSDSYISILLRVCIFFSILIFFMIFLKEFEFYGNISNYFDSNFLAILILYAFLFFMSNIHTSIFVGLSRFKAYNFVRLLRLSIYCSLLLLIKFFFNLGLFTVFTLLIISFLIDFLLSIYLINLTNKIKFVLIPIDILNNYAKKIWITSIVVMSNRRIDQIIIGVLIEAKFLGLYSIAVVFAELANKLTDAIAPVFFNINSKSDNKTKNLNLFFRFSRINFIITFISLIVLLLVGKFLIQIMYGNEFIYSYNILIYYLPGVLFWISTRPMYIYFSSAGLPEINSKIELYGLGIGIILLLTLIPVFGIIGAAIASTITYMINFIIATIYFNKKIIRFSFIDMILVKNEDFNFIISKIKFLSKKYGQD